MKTVTHQRALSFFRSLADENRLRLTGWLAGREASEDELARSLHLPSATVLKQLRQLKALGIITLSSDAPIERYRLDLDVLRSFCRELAEPNQGATFGPEVEAEAWERDVLRVFFEGERLKSIPIAHKRRQPVLKWLAARFEPDQLYPEAEVNTLLQNHHPDCAALRRYLVDDGYLARDHGIYWRTDGRAASKKPSDDAAI